MSDSSPTTALAHDVVANGLDANTTPVQSCVRKPLVAIHGDRPLIEAVRLMKEQATDIWLSPRTAKSSV